MFGRITSLFLGIFLMSGMLFAQQVTVTGRVTDTPDGSPLPSVNVAGKGKALGTLSGPDGKYSITVNRSDTLAYMFVGYQNREGVVRDQTGMDVALEFSECSMKEEVAIGYGTVKKEVATGPVYAVSAEDFNHRAITSSQELATSKIAGVRITGADAMIRIRGKSS